MVWYGAYENDSDLRYSEVPLKGKKSNTCQNIGGSSTQDDPADQILGGRDSCNPCNVDAYGRSAKLPETDWATATGNMYRKFGECWTCGSGDTFADRQTHTDPQTLHRR